MSIEQFRQNRANELLSAARVMESVFAGNILTSPIYVAAESLKSTPPTLKDGTVNNDYWGYEIEDLIIPVSASNHMRPKGISQNKIELILNMRLIADSKNWQNLNDPLVDLNFNVVVRSVGETTHTFCFHIDKHDPAIAAAEPHPTYHLQIASNPFKEDDFAYGNTLFMDTPRLVHHPIDMILGLGFLTSNFFPVAFDLIQEDGYFISLYKKYQNKILKPYFHTLANHWDFKMDDVVWPKQHVCPIII